jgi:hypothetical protein
VIFRNRIYSSFDINVICILCKMSTLH